MSDTNQWVVQVEGAAPPPEIPWALIAGTVVVVGAVGVYAWRKKR